MDPPNLYISIQETSEHVERREERGKKKENSTS